MNALAASVEKSDFWSGWIKGGGAATFSIPVGAKTISDFSEVGDLDDGYAGTIVL